MYRSQEERKEKIRGDLSIYSVLSILKKAVSSQQSAVSSQGLEGDEQPLRAPSGV
ncbi:MAG: hypothetical protein F6K17_07505 [Okeania sp. SIO3C4]|nr:hypothetical protein [Okeania sp. SIO3B3]NER02481.1 hypothetical protein [Okeania sp. SIO3C4]